MPADDGRKTVSPLVLASKIFEQFGKLDSIGHRGQRLAFSFFDFSSTLLSSLRL